MRKLFSANSARIGRFDGPPVCDAVPDTMTEGSPDGLKADLTGLLGKASVFHRAIDLVRYASDASPYRLIPQIVALPRTTADIVKLFRYCHEKGRHATFRAGGTASGVTSQGPNAPVPSKFLPIVHCGVRSWKSRIVASLKME